MIRRAARVLRHPTARLGLLLALWLSAAGAATAQNSGLLTAARYAELPAGLPVSVELYDDSDLNLALRDALVDALEAQGWLIRPEAVYVLLFDRRIEEGRFDERDATLGEFEAKSDGPVQLNLNVWSSNQSSLLGGKGETVGGFEQAVVHLNLVLQDRETNEVIWQADAYGAIGQSDEATISRALLPPLAEAFGETVREQAIVLP